MIKLDQRMDNLSLGGELQMDPLQTQYSPGGF